MQLFSAFLQVIDSSALNLRDTQKIFNVMLNVEYASILKATHVLKNFECYCQSWEIEWGKRIWKEKLQKKNVLTAKKVSPICN